MLMIYHQYKYKFYLNLNHSICINEKQGEIHPHTWEIVVDIATSDSQFKEFSKIEKKLEQLLEKYQDQYINSIAPFQEMNPTIENAAEVFSAEIRQSIEEAGWILLTFEISETPTRTYIINMLERELKNNSQEN